VENISGAERLHAASAELAAHSGAMISCSSSSRCRRARAPRGEIFCLAPSALSSPEEASAQQCATTHAVRSEITRWILAFWASQAELSAARSRCMRAGSLVSSSAFSSA